MKQYLIQLELKFELERKLAEFTIENGWTDDIWNTNQDKYFIEYNVNFNEFEISHCSFRKASNIYYISKDVAQMAINEIIIPFMKENANFKW